MPIDSTGRFYEAGGDPPTYPPGIAGLYAVERQIGSALQKDTLAVWFAATTFFTAAVGLLVLMQNQTIDVDTVAKVWVVLTLPIISCAFAGYHLILFGTSAIRSRSIEWLEMEIIKQCSPSVQRNWNSSPSEIGSKAETDRVNYGRSGKVVPIVQFFAFLPPYFYALILAAIAIFSLPKLTIFHVWVYRAYWPFLLIYAVILVVYIILGVQSIALLKSGKQSGLQCTHLRRFACHIHRLK